MFFTEGSSCGPMLIRLSILVAFCLGLGACQLIEFNVNPQPPQPHFLVPPPRTDQPTSATTATRAVPGGRPVPAAVSLVPTTGTLRLTVEGALILSLANNPALKVDEINPALRKTFESVERAAFDPTLTAGFQYSSSRIARTTTVNGVRGTSGTLPVATQRILTSTRTRQTSGNVGISEFLPTGTDISLTLTPSKTTVSGAPNDNPYAAPAALSVTQNLLRGAGLAVNLASLRQARIDTLSSEYELRGFTQTLTAQVEEAYWDYLYAERQVKIFENALKVSQSQLADTQARIEVGKLAASERFAAEAEVASRRETLINGYSNLETSRVNLLKLVTPPGRQAPLGRPIMLLSEPVLPQGNLEELANHIALALRDRPDLNQARLSVKRDELEIVKTKNGLLPQLNFFVDLGKTGFGTTFSNSFDDLSDGKSNSVSTGLQYSYALGNRAARAQYRSSLLTREQALEAVANLAQTVEVDVRNAYTEVRRVRAQVSATAVTRRLQEETLRTEQEKFRVGRSTSLLVAQAERDLLVSQIAELQAFVSYLKAVVELYRLDGSLLERRGIACPGRQPVTLP